MPPTKYMYVYMYHGTTSHARNIHVYEWVLQIHYLDITIVNSRCNSYQCPCHGRTRPIHCIADSEMRIRTQKQCAQSASYSKDWDLVATSHTVTIHRSSIHCGRMPSQICRRHEVKHWDPTMWIKSSVESKGSTFAMFPFQPFTEHITSNHSKSYVQKMMIGKHDLDLESSDIQPLPDAKKIYHTSCWQLFGHVHVLLTEVL